MIILKVFLGIIKIIENLNLNSNMIILKADVVVPDLLLPPNLNSNMIILKVVSQFWVITSFKNFKFQYDNT